MPIQFPRVLTDRTVAAFCAMLSKQQDAPQEITVDFTGIPFARPYVTLMLAVALKQFVEYRRAQGLSTRRICWRDVDEIPASSSYLMHVGFFQYLGIDLGNAPNATSGNSRYLPITVMSQNTLRERHGRLDNIQTVVERESSRLVSVLIGEGDRDPNAQRALGYCLTEIARNVFEHAGVDECIVMAQRWNTGEAEIALIDQGIGIFDSISPVHRVETVPEAVYKALEPGVSGDRVVRGEGHWNNTGFGLHILSNLGRQFGSFTINSAGEQLSMSRTNHQWDTTSLRGTAIKLLINTQNIGNFNQAIQDIVEIGERLIEEARRGERSASKNPTA